MQQLNRALASLHLPASAGSDFTSATSQGLAQLYRSAGHDAPSRMDRREILFIPSFPATVITNSAPVGAPATKSDLVVLTCGTSSATAQIPADAARTITKGARATLDLDKAAVPAVVESIDAPAGQTVTVHLRPETAFPEGSDGKDVRINIEQQLSRKGALAVPLSAVYSRTDGRTVVLVQHDKTETTVEVTPGASADGMVEVTPVADTPGLKMGDAVVVNGP
ncbi:efflux RND transporter periplasmic adaptor subunit [Luteococcus sp. H138]|uniref:efflux RND transporter periplasmic adaptor subunit n=1 Tax=unclassified Luteococcus TaxID=2639923 RepID=UPI00313C2A9B